MDTCYCMHSNNVKSIGTINAKAILWLSIVLGAIAPVCAQGYKSNKPLPQPVVFGEGIISTEDYESHEAFSPSGDTLFFIKSAPDFSTWTICLSYYKNGKWSQPEIAPFSGQYNDADPFVTADGKTLYFISNRPVHPGDTAKKEDTDIWKLSLAGGKWGMPVHLDYPVSSDADEWYPTLADNGNLYFGSARKGGKGADDIYKCVPENGKYLRADNLGDSINTEAEEYEPFIAPDESYMIFMAARPATARGDLYISYHSNGTWTKAEVLPAPFNSPRNEYSPRVTRDGKYFFFASCRYKDFTILQKENMQQLHKRIRSAGNGLGDIYQVDCSALQLKGR
jgi:hypothetical protein